MAVQGYGQIAMVKDPATRMLLQALFDQVNALQGQVTDLQAVAVQRTATGVPITGLATGMSDPVAATDGVNKQTLQRYVAGQLAAFAAPAP